MAVALLLVLSLSVMLPKVTAQEASTLADYLIAWEAYLDAWRTGDVSLLDAAITNDFVRHSQWEGINAGRDEVATAILGFHEATGGGVTFLPVKEAMVHDDYMWMASDMLMPEANESTTIYGVARFDDGMLAEAWLANTPLLLLEVFGATALTEEEFTPAEHMMAWEAYVDAWREGDVNLLETAVTSDFVRHTQWDGVNSGHAGRG